MFFGDVCTIAGGIGSIIFFVACVIVGCTQMMLSEWEKKFVEMLIAFVVSLIMFFVGFGIRSGGGYISQNYDWIKTSERTNLIHDCPEDSTMTSYCAYKWKEYRKDSTEAAEEMRKYLEKK